jgi:hypothetical protein
MYEIAMTAFAASLVEASALQISNQLPYFRRHPPTPNMVLKSV